MDADDYIFEDFLSKKKKKKVDGGKKGKRGERNLTKILNTRFKTQAFSRTIGSGNRWSQVSFMPQHAQDTFTGDIVTPKNFAFVIENKCGYNDIDLNSVFEGGDKKLDEFLGQVTGEATRCNRKPIVIWKKNYKPMLAIVLTSDLPNHNWDYRLIYRDWSIVLFTELLAQPDSYWFVEPQT